MGVAAHLGIDLVDYDARIRTFIPHYEEMLDIAASAVDPKAGIIVDLGVGTAALSARCRAFAIKAKFVGIDSDQEVLKAAENRLPSAQFICSSFLRCEIPSCDVVVASFALHHVRTRSAKLALYRRIAAALRSGGQIINVDCQPAEDRKVAQRQFEKWKTHLRSSYGEEQASEYLAAWSKEDVYVPLAAEIALMEQAGLRVE